MNNFYRLEGGLLLGEIFRVSTGVGQPMFNEQTLVSGSEEGECHLSAISFQHSGLSIQCEQCGGNGERKFRLRQKFRADSDDANGGHYVPVVTKVCSDYDTGKGKE